MQPAVSIPSSRRTSTYRRIVRRGGKERKEKQRETKALHQRAEAPKQKRPEAQQYLLLQKPPHVERQHHRNHHRKALRDGNLNTTEKRDRHAKLQRKGDCFAQNGHCHKLGKKQGKRSQNSHDCAQESGFAVYASEVCCGLTADRRRISLSNEKRKRTTMTMMARMSEVTKSCRATCQRGKANEHTDTG